MIILPYSDTIREQAAAFLEDLADTQAGIERCRACFQQLHECGCPDLVAAGVAPSPFLEN